MINENLAGNYKLQGAYISHRLSACKVCDRILTFSQGKVIENGTFEELMKLKGKFYDLYSAQREYYE